MGIDWDEVVEGVLTNRFVKRVSMNPLLTSLVIMILVILIAYLLFESQYEDDTGGLLRALLRLGIYTFGVAGFMTFLHYRNMEKVYEGKIVNKGQEEVMRNVIETNKGSEPEVEPGSAVPEIPEASAATPTPLAPNVSVSVNVGKPEPNRKAKTTLVSPRVEKP
jgi:hypothetical protein